MFHPSSELFTGCPSKYVLSITIRYQLCHSFFSDSDKTPVYLSVFFMCTLHKDSSAPLPTQELYAYPTLRPKHLDISLSPMSGIPCLAKLDTFSHPLHSKMLWRYICLKPTTASKFSISHTPPQNNVFLKYFSPLMCCVMLAPVCARLHACVCTQYNNTLLILKKEIQLSAFDK